MTHPMKHVLMLAALLLTAILPYVASSLLR